VIDIHLFPNVSAGDPFEIREKLTDRMVQWDLFSPKRANTQVGPCRLAVKVIAKWV